MPVAFFRLLLLLDKYLGEIFALRAASKGQHHDFLFLNSRIIECSERDAGRTDRQAGMHSAHSLLGRNVTPSSRWRRLLSPETPSYHPRPASAEPRTLSRSPRTERRMTHNL